MTTKLKIFFSIFSLILFIAFGVASSVAHKTFSDGNKWIPEYFNPNKHILLVQTNLLGEKQNTKMDEFLQKNYPYKYEIVTVKEIKNGSSKYSNKEVYKFGVLWEIKYSTYISADGTGHTSTNRAADLVGHFYDRSSNKDYGTAIRTSGYGQAGYKPFFNTITKKFKNEP